MITREQFIDATGQEPIQDDLDRCNCPAAGDVGHWLCGWDAEENLPRFMIHPLAAVVNPCDTVVQRERDIEFRPRNFYEPPFYTMITSGEFWRCFHGVTRFVDGGCPDCKKLWEESGGEI